MKLSRLLSKCISIPYSQVGISASYAVKKDRGTLYIFFEDSEGKNDWKINLNFPAKPYKRMGKTVWFAHRGFSNEWKEIEGVLAEDIAAKNVRKVVISGYSHGAAIALLCHEYVWYNRPDLREAIEGYGFGCPRVIWGMIGPSVKRRWARFTVVRNIDDFVTHLPPSFWGYTHVGKMLEVGEKGKYSPIEAHYAKNILTELQLYETEHLLSTPISDRLVL